MREAYAQKKALAKEAIPNNQCKFIYVKQYTFHLIQTCVNLLLPNMNKDVKGQQKRAKHWYLYGALSEERKRYLQDMQGNICTKNNSCKRSY